MTPPQDPLRPHMRFLPAFGPLVLSACLAAGAMAPAAPCRAADSNPDKTDKPDKAQKADKSESTDVHPVPQTRPDAKPDSKSEGGLLHPVSPEGGPLTQPTTLPTITVVTTPATGPTTGPSTQPATKPAIHVSPPARAELDALRDAYRELKSLHLAGTISADLDINGEQQSPRGTFEADYEARPDAAPRFRQVTRDAEGLDAHDAPGSVVGSTGEKLYYFDPEFQQYRTVAASKKKFAAGKMPRPYYTLLAEQDPSLLLALSDDAAEEVLDGIASIEKVEDVKIGDDACPVLRMGYKSGDSTDLVIDPKTHLLRRSVADEQKGLKKEGQPDVKKAVVTVDYTESTPGAAVQDDSFAWAPPQGAHEVTATAEDAPSLAMEHGGGGEAGPATALVGKPAPDFKLKGMDGKEVASADLKGSVVVLDFWATWCGPCRASLPHLNKLYETKKGAGLKVFALDQKEDEDDVRQGITELKLTLPVLLDSDGKAGEQYHVTGIPQTVIIGKDGLVKKVVVGAGPPEEIDKAVEEAMK